MRGDDLKARCARGSFSLSIGTVSAKGLALVSKMILTRLLAKNEIGLMVMIFSLLSLFETIIEVGVRKSIIQHKDGGREEYLNMAWWFQGVRSLLLYLTAFVISPWLSRFYFANKTEILEIYSAEDLCLLMRIAFLYILLNGFASPRLQVLTREFRFLKKVLLNQGTAALGILVTIGLAFTMRNVWAIVWGNLAGAGLLMVFSYIACPFRPRFRIHKESLIAILQFARGMVGLPILTFVAFNMDILVLGKVADTSLVGLYGMALSLANVPRDLYGKIVSPVLLPAFAEKQEKKTSICNGILSLTKITMLAALPVVALTVGCGGAILSLIYGSNYGEVAGVFVLQCCYITVVIQTVPLAQVFYGIGCPGQQRLFVLIRAVLLVTLIYPAVKFYGLYGAVGTLLFVNLAGLGLQVVLLKRDIGLKLSSYFLTWVPGLVAAGIQLLFVYLIMLMWPQDELIHLAAGSIICLLVIGGAFLQQVRSGSFRQSSMEQGAE